jgi:hypothetical protein
VCASRRASTGKQDVNNRQARPSRAAHGRRLAARDTASESDEGEAEGADWDECYGVRMSPANPRYVGRGDSTCGGEVVYTIPEIKVLLRSQPDDAQRWLTTSKMGWALTRERIEVINEKDERDCKQVARQLAPMISKSGRSGNRTRWNAWMTKEDSSLKRQRSLITYGVHGRRGRS